ncbi:hypothetical protein AMATHDRAFT_141969 [Amanita thiersii Skay4041]|uniref:Uncharacterized protein n=1 Tax=Amanita thiersii Skay4041 TaxID=703135 RepID=A0A2A9NQU4_9AGAR|nr:hypothetical protein AMATHDRAFT_141969 [Amanita thiersii Skay4041]
MYSVFTTLLASLAIGVAQGKPVANEQLETRDIWSPKILTPNAATVWTVGHVETVTCSCEDWTHRCIFQRDTSDQPASVSNGGRVLFEPCQYPPSFRFCTQTDEATIMDGSIQITVPQVVPGTYNIVLFGDSGNLSPPFQVVAA